MIECPKCGGTMVSTDRSGIMIEECGGCRGVYLDRGELELLIDAEREYLATLPENADTSYQGRHRHGVVRQVFGTPDSGSNGSAAVDSIATAARTSAAESGLSSAGESTGSTVISTSS